MKKCSTHEDIPSGPESVSGTTERVRIQRVGGDIRGRCRAYPPTRIPYAERKVPSPRTNLVAVMSKATPSTGSQMVEIHSRVDNDACEMSSYSVLHTTIQAQTDQAAQLQNVASLIQQIDDGLRRWPE